jgi:hypothetical protein
MPDSSRCALFQSFQSLRGDFTKQGGVDSGLRVRSVDQGRGHASEEYREDGAESASTSLYEGRVSLIYKVVKGCRELTVNDLCELSEEVDEITVRSEILFDGCQDCFGAVGTCLSAISVADNLSRVSWLPAKHRMTSWRPQ